MQAAVCFNIIDTRAYDFIKYSFKVNASSPTRTNENSLILPYKYLGGCMLGSPLSSARPILLAVNTPP